MDDLRLAEQKQLFEEWKALGARISDMGNFVQNEVYFSTDKIREWQQLCYTAYEEVGMLIIKTVAFLKT